ncbi:unnamed protein product [Symbiodinium sp. CCMP2592]|nr:unnamed protein product [Symbiodinium sp. CCMP2592]
MVVPTFEISQEQTRRAPTLEKRAPWCTKWAYMTIVLEVLAWLTVPIVSFLTTPGYLVYVFGWLLLVAICREGVAAVVKDPILLCFRRGAIPSWSFRCFTIALRFFIIVSPLEVFNPHINHSTTIPAALERVNKDFKSSRGLGQNCSVVPEWLQPICKEGRFPVSAYTECVEKLPSNLRGFCNAKACTVNKFGDGPFYTVIVGPMLALFGLCICYALEACFYALEACYRCCRSYFCDDAPSSSDSEVDDEEKIGLMQRLAGAILLALQVKEDDSEVTRMVKKIWIAKDIFLVAADVLLDSNCVLTFFQTGHHLFGTAALAILLWSLGQQLVSHSLQDLYSEAVASIGAGMLSDGFLRMTRTEQSVEAPLSLVLQVYTCPYVTVTSTWALLTFVPSIVLSICTISEAVFKLLYVDMLSVVLASGQRDASYERVVRATD